MATSDLRKFSIRTSHLLIRLILPVFFFEAASCIKNVYKIEYE